VGAGIGCQHVLLIGSNRNQFVGGLAFTVLGNSVVDAQGIFPGVRGVVGKVNGNEPRGNWMPIKTSIQDRPFKTAIEN
jgi:hypothetical protein